MGKNNSPRPSLEPSLVLPYKGRLSGLSEDQREGDNGLFDNLRAIYDEFEFLGSSIGEYASLVSLNTDTNMLSGSLLHLMEAKYNCLLKKKWEEITHPVPLIKREGD